MVAVGRFTALLYASLLAAVVSVAALTCDHCFEYTNWSDCERNVTPAECGVVLTNDLHTYLNSLNPSLPQTPPVWNPRYECYSIELELKFTVAPYRTLVEKGCTYMEANFCQGWETELVHVVNCTTSRTGVSPVDESDKESSSPSHRLLMSWITVASIAVAASNSF